MKITVLLRMVPDVVEELEIGPEGKALDTDAVRMILSESDDHALEQALILKERHGGKVVAMALDAPDVEDTLFTALAKGADRAVKITDGECGASTREGAHLFAQLTAADPEMAASDLILTGVQAIDDLDGLAAPLLAHERALPYLGIVTAVSADPAAHKASVIKEFPGSVRAEYEVPLPAVLGIQAAERPLRYVPVAKIRAAMKTGRIETVEAPSMADAGPPLVEVLSMAKPSATGQALMLEGEPGQVSNELCGILRERGLL